jgi:hypothetical protein
VEPRDSAARANSDYQLIPPGEFRFLTQRLDSVAGQYGVPGRYVIPFTGEVRRDGVFALVAFAGDGVQQYVAGRVVRDTLWMELTNLASVERWPPRTRAAFVRRPRGAPFTRLLGGAAIIVPPDSATLDSIRRDSIRMDSIRRASVPPGAPVPGAVPQPGVQPGVVPPQQQPGVVAPQQQPGVVPPPQRPRVTPPPAPAPRPRPPAPRPQPKAEPPPTQGPPPPQEFPPPQAPPTNPQPPMPRETINFPPPRAR